MVNGQLEKAMGVQTDTQLCAGSVVCVSVISYFSARGYAISWHGTSVQNTHNACMKCYSRIEMNTGAILRQQDMRFVYIIGMKVDIMSTP